MFIIGCHCRTRPNWTSWSACLEAVWGHRANHLQLVSTVSPDVDECKELVDPKQAKFSVDDSAVGDIAAILIFLQQDGKEVHCVKRTCTCYTTLKVVLFEAVDVRYFGT